MPQTTHIERHFTGTETVRDIVIGISDGLTVPLAPAADLSGAGDTTRIIVTAGYRGSCSRDSASSASRWASACGDGNGVSGMLG